MAFFDWLFKRVAANAEQTAVQGAEPALERDFFTLRSRQFFGRFSTSANGRYRLAWGGGAESGTARSREMQRYLLLDGEKILVEGKVVRP